MSLNQASRLHAEGHHAAALFEYAQLAATGIEPAQFNAAYLLSQQSGASCAPLARGGGAVTSGDRLEHRLLENSSAQSIKHEHHTRGTVVAAKSSTSSNNTLVSNKAAYLSLSVPSSELTTSSELEECEVRALLLFGLSAAQNNVEALLALGDFHYYGRAALPANKAEVGEGCFCSR